MRMTIVFTIISFLISYNSISQSVKIGSAGRKISWSEAEKDSVFTLAASVVNTDPKRIKSFSFVNGNSGTLSINHYKINDLKISESQTNLATFTICFNDLDKLPKKSESVILKFELELLDTIIYNYDTITLEHKNGEFKWHEDQTNLWRYEYNQYTDLLGFDNQRPNGLLQQELIVKFPIRLPVWGNPDKDFKLQFFRSIIFTALFNRIDKSKEYQNYPSGTALPSNSVNMDSVKPFLTTLDIFKYSNLQLGLSLNLFTIHAGNFRINFGYEVALLRNRPYYSDTIRFNNVVYTKNDVRPVYSHVHKYEVYLNNNKPIAQKFDVIFNAGIMYVLLKDSYYRQFDAGEVDIFDKATTLLSASDAVNGRKAEGTVFLGGTLKLKWGTNLKNSIFFRTNYYYQSGGYRRYVGPTDVVDPKRFQERKFYNHFLQLQLGIALHLNKFFGIEEN